VADASAAVEQEEVGEVKTREFLNRIEHQQIVDAIRRAERKSSGEVRVFVTRKAVADPVTAAKHHFQRMGMAKTRWRNSVLLLVAPRSQNFAVIGDTAIHERCGEEFWHSVAEGLSGHFHKNEFTIGLVHAIDRAGDLLAEHFPRQPDDTNELPDRVEED
jgi:uncharacterized membrane protein